MTLTDADCMTLLRRLDAYYHQTPYPPMGLEIHGQMNAPRVEVMIAMVQTWCASIQPEAMR